jgi:aspartate/methionine/tyrosine aminotransferase
LIAALSEPYFANACTLFFQVEYVKELIQQAGVVAVPGRGFFHTNLSLKNSSDVDCSYQKRYIRFAFCKSNATLAAAAQNLELFYAKGLKLHSFDKKDA